jgi:hypothetical protein
LDSVSRYGGCDVGGAWIWLSGFSPQRGNAVFKLNLCRAEFAALEPLQRAPQFRAEYNRGT